MTDVSTQGIAEAFSSHRFDETFAYLAADVRWVVPGQLSVEGKDAVVAACEQSVGETDALDHVEFERFVSVGGTHVAAVDAVARYVGADGSVSVVSSADVYEFDDAGLVRRITSYAVELEESSPG